MTWTLTTGMRRADAVVDQYAKDMEQAVAFVVPQIMRSRLFDLVAAAIDQALADAAWATAKSRSSTSMEWSRARQSISGQGGGQTYPRKR